jgi:hypothetical protein
MLSIVRASATYACTRKITPRRLSALAATAILDANDGYGLEEVGIVDWRSIDSCASFG